VFIAGRRQAELDKAVAEIGENVTAVKADISKLDDLDRFYETVARSRRTQRRESALGRYDPGAPGSWSSD
jgi:hypothetical protein